jgi:DNA-binding response OmpR family regulator
VRTSLRPILTPRFLKAGRKVRILVCEDEPDMVEILREFLVSQGYEVAVSTSGPECLRQCIDCDPELVLLDIMLPGKDGWEVLQEIRQQTDRPVILLTALGRVDDKVKGLSQGADDYIQKPFSLEELKARIEAVLRRYRPQLGKVGLAIDETRKTVELGGQSVLLSPKEYALLKLLASKPGEVFSPQEILSHLWPKNAYASVQDVQKYVYLLRRKIEEAPSDPQIVLTVRGFGYRLGI